MTEQQSKDHVRFLAGHLGIVVQDIPRNACTPTPDFEFFCGEECTLVELKRREEGWDLSEEEERSLDAGNVVGTVKGVGKHGTISERIRGAVRQLAAYQTVRHSFRVVWLCVYGDFSDLATQRARAALLGEAPVFNGESGVGKQAYFFDPNRFYDCREELDGAIVSEESPQPGGAKLSAQIILNPLSPRYEKLRASKLVESFGQGVLDPLVVECKGDGLIVGPEADRTSEQTKLDYLAAKYGIPKPWTLKMQMHAGLIRADLKRPGRAGESSSRAPAPSS